jgi:hypothetical protein
MRKSKSQPNSSTVIGFLSPAVSWQSLPIRFSHRRLHQQVHDGALSPDWSSGIGERRHNAIFALIHFMPLPPNVWAVSKFATDIL